jgi:release factor glutamine methyltransferase
MESLNRKEALARARGELTAGGVEDAPLEAELLLRHVLGLSRAGLYQDLDGAVSPAQEETYFRLVERRRQGEPSAYITGHREFYGLDFYIDSRVLIPRPETELLVEKAIALARGYRFSRIADIGTGGGAIAVALALNLPEAQIEATDISAPALEVARINCRYHGVAERVRLYLGDLLDPLPGPVDLIVANLPYVRASELSPAGPLRYEPPLSLNGGPDGLEPIVRLCRRAGAKLCPGGGLVVEIGQGQGEAVASVLREVFPSARPEISPDPAGIERVVSLRLTGDGL